MSVEASVPLRRLVVVAMVLSVGVGLDFLEDGLAQSKGQMNIAVALSLLPLCFDPAETPVTGNFHAFLYLLHDALIEPFPENAVPPLRGEVLGEECRWVIHRVQAVRGFDIS
jgi:hypothetical protein